MAELRALPLCALLASCTGGAATVPSDPLGSTRAIDGACSLGTAQHVARAQGHDFDALALQPLAEGAIALYSDASGSYARLLGAHGGPRAGSAARIGDRCAGGLAAAPADDGAEVACLRPGSGAWRFALHVTPEGQLRADLPQRLGAAGPASHGIVVRARGDGLAVAFHDASSEAHRVWLAELTGDGGVRAAPRQLGPRDAVVGAPELLSVGTQLYAAYVTWELAPDASGATLHVEALGAKAHTRIALQHHDPTPRLAAESGELLLSYRDRPSPRARLEQFVQRLAPDLSLRGPKLRVGRASGSGGPTLSHCGDTWFSAAPLEHGSELYVIFHALDGTLAARDPNHQCYATARSFVAAADGCSGQGLLALVAEETDPSGKPAELLGMRFDCAR